MKVRTRFAPSPTGALHIGGLRTALYSYALAKSSGGNFILRIEDTDKKREVKGSRKEIESHLKNFGLVWDELYVQSERKEKGIYKSAAEELVEKGFGFYCDCRARNAKLEGFSKVLRDPCRDSKKSSGAIKLKVPESEIISYTDYILKRKITWNTGDVTDATLLKSDGFPTYHLAVVVDDNSMKVTHALRGYDWLPSTPIHLLVYKYLRFNVPKIGHLTDILDPKGGKLSKRKGSVSVNEFLNEGYLRGALLNFIMLLGWAPKNNREFFTLDEFVEAFNPNGFQRTNPVFNKVKLDWFNAQYLQKSKDSVLADEILKFYGNKFEKKVVETTVPLVKTRITKLAEYESLAGFFYKKPKVDKRLFGKNYKMHLKVAKKALYNLKSWKLKVINQNLIKEVEEKGFKTGEFFMDLRIAITGQKVTPPINESIEILGKEKTITRLESVF